MRTRKNVINVTFYQCRGAMRPKYSHICNLNADVLKLVDKPDLGSGASRRVGSSPPVRTNPKKLLRVFLFVGLEAASQSQNSDECPANINYFLILPRPHKPEEISSGFFIRFIGN